MRCKHGWTLEYLGQQEQKKLVLVASHPFRTAGLGGALASVRMHIAEAEERIAQLKALISKELISIENGAGFILDDDGKIVTDIAACNTCDMEWNDALITSRTPAPSARCPYEYIHPELAEFGHLTGQPAKRWFPVSASPIPPTAIEPRSNPATPSAR